MRPTILVRPEDGELVPEEIFGPVLTFETVSSVADAIASANRTAYGLTAGIVTNDLAVAKAFWRVATAGTVKVNVPLSRRRPFCGRSDLSLVLP
jgi:acyl-CoA reductase-like NAD-dependent aldehyde dehydrogenase